ncbi:transcription initiation factor TFIID subunit 6b-like [Gossypium raimondii]|uniref:transcription initiation factor TFIID subunit 6b-like n=1 Tax=Gossypium raimondii TaxID=29730 RepID=UPI00227D065D|nr:transcription initiation factor TFIID subunit 6b-like [Gossypium raimondii]
MSVWIVDVIGTWNWYFAFHAAPSDGKMAEYKEDGLSVDVKLPVKPVLSRELQLYFDKIVDITMNKSVSVLFQQALLSLATDSGLHPLVPYFTYFIADEVVLNLNNFPLMFALMRVARSLLQNEHLHIEPYLHQLMPSIITCLVAKRLGNKFTDNHWGLRNFAAKLVASICKRFVYLYYQILKHKRKASTGTLMQQQPPAKKIATESAIGMMPINSMQTDLQGAVSGFSTTIGGSNIGVSSMSRPLSNDNKTSTVLAQAWKEDTDPGNLLASLFELFGESMLSFTPKPELSFFL